MFVQHPACQMLSRGLRAARIYFPKSRVSNGNRRIGAPAILENVRYPATKGEPFEAGICLQWNQKLVLLETLLRNAMHRQQGHYPISAAIRTPKHREKSHFAAAWSLL